MPIQYEYFSVPRHWRHGFNSMNDFLKLNRIAFRSACSLESSSSPVQEVPDDWFRLARSHRVVGLWADQSERFHLGENGLRYAYGQVLHSTRLEDEAGRIMDAMGSAVPSLRLVKGPALAAQAWPRPGMRSYDDLDFRCDKDALDDVTHTVIELGYQAEVKDVRHRESLWHFGWGLGFHHPEGFMLEFNHRMFPPHYPWPERLTWDTPSEWTSQIFDQMTVECPTPALHLLLSCAHAAWHGWERLGWLVDIAGLLVLHDNLFAHAEQMVKLNRFPQRALHCGCSVADRIFGPLPGVPPLNPAHREVVEKALELLMRQSPEVSLETQRAIHRRLMSFSEFIRYTVRRLTTPGDPDFKQWSLPRRLHCLYWVLRPTRIFLRRGRFAPSQGGMEM